MTAPKRDAPTEAHAARLRRLTPERRFVVLERAAIIQEACRGTTWPEADDMAWQQEGRP